MVAETQDSDSRVHTGRGVLDVATQRDMAERASLLLDPALFLDNVHNSTPTYQAPHSVKIASPLDLADQSWSNISTGLPRHNEDQHCQSTSYTIPDDKLGLESHESRESFEQSASSLVSPPASSHNDAGESPPTARSQWIPSRRSSDQSRTQLKQMQRVQQRCTPESGPLERASSSSDGEITPEQAGQPKLADLTDSYSILKARSELKYEYMADEESLRLIKQLQAQDLGLRRRGKT